MGNRTADVVGNLSDQDYEVISTNAQNVLRLMDDGQLYEVLGLAKPSCKACEFLNIMNRKETSRTILPGVFHLYNW